MKIHTLVFQEIAHRKMNFAIGLIAVAAAAAVSVAVLTLLAGYQQQTSRQLAAQAAELEGQLKQFEIEHNKQILALNDEIRKITKDLGFNVIILPAEQNLSEFHAGDVAEKTMPEEFVDRLAKSAEVTTIAHLRAKLVRRIDWTEQNRPLLLMGVTGLFPLMGPVDKKKPLAEPVPPGTIHVGNQLAKDLDLKKNDSVTIRGEKFVVTSIYLPRGTKDDITAWVHLATAQKMLGLQGRINMMEALNCNCKTKDRLREIRDNITQVLGESVQVIEMQRQAEARERARDQVAMAGMARARRMLEDNKALMDQERNKADAAIARLTQLATVLLSLVVVGACLMVGLVSLMNVRERRAEIGVLRALGTRSRQILGMFVARAALLGLAGAAIGYLLGYLGGAAWQSAAYGAAGTAAKELFLPQVLIGALVLGPLLAVLAGWLPAVKAVSDDPAVALREQ